ncbi:hypothetical protein CHS0354_039293 [Potamilus streckersoni]|uniref:Uncharacterized protein n=1 Tax=Potamilus streckersoni TaxID=2493646 RepID=A0AAE0RMT7_9BIVA|nr:hypothetical protein CHS0354_039293 [Potamilus streckersoni]
MNRDSTESLNSFSSTSSRQRIFRQGKPPREFSRLDFQNKYAARKGYNNGGHQMNQNFENESYDSNGENLVSRPSSQGSNFRILEDGERPGSSGSKHDLSKSLRDVIRHQRRHKFDHNSGDNTTNNKIIRHDTNSSGRYEDSTEEISTPKPRGAISKLKFALLTTVILGAITAITILIIELRDPTTSRGNHGCTALTVILNQPIVIVCYTSYTRDCIIRVTPPSTVNLGHMALLTKQERNNSGWTINYISNKNITLIGPEAKCSSEGNYTITINDTVERSPPIIITNLKINESPEIETNTSVSTPNASKEASCISHTQCKEGYTLKMLPPKNRATEFNQTCYAHFSESVGWTTHCTGQLQSYMSNASCTITCILSNTIITKASNVSIC